MGFCEYRLSHLHCRSPFTIPMSSITATLPQSFAGQNPNPFPRVQHHRLLHHGADGGANLILQAFTGRQ
jgi:hypothetical protein